MGTESFPYDDDDRDERRHSLNSPVSLSVFVILIDDADDDADDKYQHNLISTL